MQTVAKDFLDDITKALEEKKDANHAERVSAYMRNQFQYLGVKKPVIADVQKNIFRKHAIKSRSTLEEILLELWAQEHREYKYVAMDLAKFHKKLWEPSILNTFKHMLCTSSWWDTVDDISEHLVGDLVKKYQSLEDEVAGWINHDYMWLRRTAIIYQLFWKKETNEKILFNNCKVVMHEKEFFIRKAIGWALRQYSKTNPTAVREFIDQHRLSLSGLSIREGSKYL